MLTMAPGGLESINKLWVDSIRGFGLSARPRIYTGSRLLLQDPSANFIGCLFEGI